MDSTQNTEEKQKPEEQYKYLYEKMYELCKKQQWGDPFSYARSREILMANYLKHTIAPTYSGADAYLDKEMTQPVEYKSTISKFNYLPENCKFIKEVCVYYDSSTVRET